MWGSCEVQEGQCILLGCTPVLAKAADGILGIPTADAQNPRFMLSWIGYNLKCYEAWIARTNLRKSRATSRDARLSG